MLKVPELQAKKAKNEPITMLTAYDYYTAKLIQDCLIDTILVGDSLGMVFKGEDNTLNVTVDEVVYHTKAVRKGADDTFIIADLPYMSYHISLEQAKENSARFVIEAGANAVKLEGGSDSRIKAIEAIVDCEIPVVAHLGLTPQSINKFGGYRVQGKHQEQAELLTEQSKAAEAAGAFMLILEAIPEGLGKQIANLLKIPVIGIGAGRYTDGQVLVINDILALSDYKAKFSKVFEDVSKSTRTAVNSYREQVTSGVFPQKKNVYYPVDDTEK